MDVARKQYAALPSEIQHLADLRLADLLEDPDDPRCSEDAAPGQWTTTYHQGLGLILYTFRPGGPRLVILRLIY